MSLPTNSRVRRPDATRPDEPRPDGTDPGPGTDGAEVEGRGEGGFATLELVILTPVMIAFLLLVVGFGRVAHGRELLDQASAAAARAAALTSSPTAAQRAADQAAADTLVQAGLICRTARTALDLGQFHPGGQVAVAVTCTASLSGLALAGFPGSLTMTATSTSPLETYRQFDLGATP